VIGTGARGQELMDALQEHPQAEIVGLVDAYKGRLDRATSRVKGGSGAKIYPTYRELLAEKSIDAVVVAIPDHLHKAVVVDALRAGKDVYCEKPLDLYPSRRSGDRCRRPPPAGASSKWAARESVPTWRTQSQGR
jgi:predicted dehydrogenase